MNKYFNKFDFNVYNEIRMFNSNKKNKRIIKKKIFKNLNKQSIIIPYFLDKKFSIHNGEYNKVLLIQKSMIGTKVGCYIDCKPFMGHFFRKNKEKKARLAKAAKQKLIKQSKK